MRIFIVFFILALAACSHSPKISKNFKQMRQKREIASTGLVAWAQDKLIETSAENEEAVAIKLENLKRELGYIEKYSVMFISTSNLDAFKEALFVLGPFLKKYEEIWRFSTDESRSLHNDKFTRVLDKATEHIDKAAFHMKINDVEYESHFSSELFRANQKLLAAYQRLEQESSFESRYVNLSRISQEVEAEMGKRRAWFFGDNHTKISLDT